MKTKLAVVMIMVAGILSSQERFDYKVRTYFFAGFSGDAASLEKGMKICEDILAKDPKDAEAMVWHGAGQYYQSGVAFRKGDQQTGMELFRQGVKQMDDAVAIAPDNLGVRIPRGAALLTGARFMPPDRARPLIERSVADFEKAYSVQGPDLSNLGTHPRGELMIGLADAYSRLGDQEKAQAWFERIQKEMPGTPYEKSASIWLETKSLAPSQAGCLSCHTGN